MSSATQSLSRRHFAWIFTHEGRVLWADRTLWWVVPLLLTLVFYGVFTGIVETRNRDRAAAEIIASDAARLPANIESLRKLMSGIPPNDPFANAADPAAVGGGMGASHALMPTAPLAPLAFGQSDMLPSSYKVTYRSKINFIYDSEMENPWNLLSGHLDLAFVITYLLPLFIFAISYNLLSGEREQGTLRMLLSQPLSLTTLVLGKVAVRAAMLIACTALLTVIVLLIARPEVRGAEQMALLASWLGLVIAYALFWFALAVVVNSFGKSSAFNALALTASWVVWVLIVPTALNFAVQMASPVPSRTALATTTRIITAKGLNRYNELLSTDYRYAAEAESLIPKDGKLAVQPRIRAHYMMQFDVDREITKELERFDSQLAGQQKLVDRFGVISPAIIVHEGMTALAGTGSKRYLHFHNRVDSFHREWKSFFDPKIREGIAITEASLNNLPRFSWQETKADGTVSATAKRTWLLLVATALMTWLGAWRLRRYLVG